MIIVGVDPGTGSSSACGIAAFDTETREIVLCRGIWALKYQKPTHHRIKDIVAQIGAHLEDLIASHGSIAFGIESFVLRGKGGETLQRFIGATLTALPYSIDVREIQNTSMKKFVGGRGGSDKAEVAEGVAQFFKYNERSAAIVARLISEKAWDEIDALGIAIAAAGLGKRKGQVAA